MAREMNLSSPHKGCNSSSCCSPAKLWRTLQTLIKTNDKKGLSDFFKDPRQEHIVRVALTSRITNDAAMFPPSQQHKLVRLEERKLEANKYLGKSYNDLNSLQLALITSSESMVLTLLAQLKLYATTQEMKLFLNHIWGQGNTSLHLAVFLKRHSVVKTLIDLGCQPDHHLNARKKTAFDCCYYGDQRMIDLLSLHKHSETTTEVKPISVVPMTTVATTTIITTTIDKKHDNLKKRNDIIDNKIVSTDSQSRQLQQVEEEMTFDQCYLLLLQMMKPKQQHAANSKVVLPVYNNISQISVIASTVQQKQRQKQSVATQQQFVVSLTQIKKPPDIIQQPYCVLPMVTMCC